MAYQTPKTDWAPGNIPTEADFNRTEGNVTVLANLRGYPTAGGTGTAITITTGHFELADGRAFTFIAAANNSGAATTINADGKGAKSVYKPGGTSAPTIIAGKAYTVWYSLGNDCFFFKASAEGDAVAADVLAGKKFSNDADTGLTGTLALTGNAAVGDVLSGKTFYNTDPNSKNTGTMDLSNLSAGNIKNGVIINGITGTYQQVSNVNAGDDMLLYNNDMMRNHLGQAWYKLYDVQVLLSGTYRIAFDLATSYTTGMAYCTIYKNGVAYGTPRTTNTQWGATTTFTEDLSFSAGDNIQLWVKNGNVSYDTYLIHVKVKLAYSPLLTIIL